MRKRHYGFISEPKNTDFIFGGGHVPMEILVEDGNWQDYLPTKEFQAPYGFETYACVTYVVLNCLEALIKKQYGLEKNYSDRFLAIVSGTKSPGNSPQVVCEFLRKLGVTPEELWPYDTTINTWGKWSEPIPPKLYELAREFNAEWDFRYEQVPANAGAISKALKGSPLLISVTAWHPRGDKYYRPKGMRDNHATTMFYERIGEFRRAFDSYDRPHIKDIEWETVPEFVQRYWIKKRTEVAQQISLIQRIIKLMYLLLPMLKSETKSEPIAPVVVPPPQPTTREKLYVVARKSLGIDVSPSDNAPDDLACVESLCQILGKVGIETPKTLSTLTFYNWLKKSPRFIQTTENKVGNIIISPTGKGNGSIPHGHTGILGESGWILSNDSATGMWLENYTLQSWIARYRTKGGYPIYYFEAI